MKHCGTILLDRPHPNPLPQERVRDFRTQDFNNSIRVRHRIERGETLANSKNDRRAPSPGGEGGFKPFFARNA